MPDTRLFFVACVALALLAACSGGSSAKEDATERARDFYVALSDDPPEAYAMLSANCQAEIPYLDFVARIQPFRGFAGTGEVVVRDVQIAGQTHDHITLEYEVVLSSDGQEIPLDGELYLGPAEFVKEDGDWHFDDCAGFPVEDEADRPVEDDAPEAVEADPAPELPGEFVDLQSIYGGYWGNDNGPNTAPHRQSAVDYSPQGLPPAGGPHWGATSCSDDPQTSPLYCGPVPWGIYRDSWPAESVVHNMEHAGVIIWYNTASSDVVDKLEDLVEDNLSAGKRLVLMPYASMDDEMLALTSWGRRALLPIASYSDKFVQDFIDQLECRFDPEGLCDNETPVLPTPDNTVRR
jgi:hypothetical protein